MHLVTDYRDITPVDIILDEFLWGNDYGVPTISGLRLRQKTEIAIGNKAHFLTINGEHTAFDEILTHQMYEDWPKIR